MFGIWGAVLRKKAAEFEGIVLSVLGRADYGVSGLRRAEALSPEPLAATWLCRAPPGDLGNLLVQFLTVWKPR